MQSAEEWAEEMVLGLEREVATALRIYARECVEAWREQAGAALQKQISIHRDRERYYRKIGKAKLEDHHRWSTIVLEAATEAFRTLPVETP